MVVTPLLFVPDQQAFLRFRLLPRTAYSRTGSDSPVPAARLWRPSSVGPTPAASSGSPPAPIVEHYVVVLLLLIVAVGSACSVIQGRCVQKQTGTFCHKTVKDVMSQGRIIPESDTSSYRSRVLCSQCLTVKRR
jgi:hypothetical protein